MATNPTKWTHELRMSLYNQLVKEFGSYELWNMSHYPIDKKIEYESFISKFAERITAVSGKETTILAIKQQIAWAFTKQVSVTMLSSWIDNKYCAYNAGFISSKYIPKLILCEYNEIETAETVEE
jgi:hypothetical protein